VKVAHLSTRYPPGPGGVERHVAELAPRLAACGYTVDVLTSDLYQEYPWERLPPTVPREEKTAFGTVRRLPVWSLPGELHYPFFRNLGRALEQARPDIVHVHTYGTNQVAVARRFKRRHRTPFVLTAHFHPLWSIEGGPLRRRIRSFYDRSLAGPLVQEAAYLIVQTKEEERMVRGLGLALPPVEIIPPGYSPLPAPTAGAPSFQERFRIEGPFLLFVGRLASNKGLLDLVDAFALLGRHDPTARLVLVGEDGGMGARVDSRARERGVSDRVHRLGRVADDAVLASAYREARITVLPSEYEAFGLVLLESLAQGTPVVATRVGGIPEVVDDGQTGLLVPPCDPEALAVALERLWSDPELRRRFGEQGRTQVIPRYTWETVADRIDRLYRMLGAP